MSNEQVFKDIKELVYTRDIHIANGEYDKAKETQIKLNGLVNNL